MASYFGMDSLKRLQDGLQSQITKRVYGGRGTKFFSTVPKRGEASELQQDLASGDHARQKAALKRIIANMTLGRDVSQLFVDVVKVGQSANLETKKLVYLYVLSNAKLQPEAALLAVNTFLQDTQHASPIVRALALRTMLCMRVPSILEYMLDPMRAALQPKEDAYVRKTAAVALGKLFHQAPKLFIQSGFLDLVTGLLTDAFPVVASNAAAILLEMMASGLLLKAVAIEKSWVMSLLNALGECTEWGQVYILDLVAAYDAPAADAGILVERIIPRLKHASSAVVLSAIKTIVALVHRLPMDQQPAHLARVTTALLTLINSSDPETQFVVCRVAAVLVQAHPLLLQGNVEAFFIRFTDPAYVKLEKLKLLLRIVSPGSAVAVAHELGEYMAEVDPTFVAEVLKAVATLAIKNESVAPRCADLLLNTLTTRDELLADVLRASRDVCRKHPTLVPLLLPPLVERREIVVGLDEDAKVAFVWLLGEYCEFVEDGQQVLSGLLDSMREQEVAVQLALLTSVVKLFLRDPARLEGTVKSVLDAATTQASNADLRDRAFFYGRLLGLGIGAAKLKQIVHGREPPVVTDQAPLETAGPLESVRLLTSAAAVLHRMPQTFVRPYGAIDCADVADDEDDDTMDASDPAPSAQENAAEKKSGAPAAPSGDPLASLFGGTGGGPSGGHLAQQPAAALRQSSPIDDLFGAPAGPSSVTAPSTGVAGSSPVVDPFFGAAGAVSAVSTHSPAGLPECVAGVTNNGVTISAAFVSTDSTPIAFRLRVDCSASAMTASGAALQFNRNAFGFVPAAQLEAAVVRPGSCQEWTTAVTFSSGHLAPLAAPPSPGSNPIAVEVGFKTNEVPVKIFSVVPPAGLILGFAPVVPKEIFVREWRGMDPTATERRLELKAVTPPRTIGAVRQRLEQHRVGVVHCTDDFEPRCYGVARTHSGALALLEATATALIMRCAAVDVALPALAAVAGVI